jgi:hypothetical protein
MPPPNANPGAGGARAHGISQIDTAPTTQNHRTAQQVSHAARTATLITSFTLADGAGTLLVPVQVPFDTRWFENQIRAHVIAVIQSSTDGGAA